MTFLELHSVYWHGQGLGSLGQLVSGWWPPDNLGLTSDGRGRGSHLASARPQKRSRGRADLATLRGHDGGCVHIPEVNVGPREWDVWLWGSWGHTGCSVYIAISRHRVLLYGRHNVSVACHLGCEGGTGSLMWMTVFMLPVPFWLKSQTSCTLAPVSDIILATKCVFRQT